MCYRFNKIKFIAYIVRNKFFYTFASKLNNNKYKQTKRYFIYHTKNLITN